MPLRSEVRGVLNVFFDMHDVTGTVEYTLFRILDRGVSCEFVTVKSENSPDVSVDQI